MDILLLLAVFLGCSFFHFSLTCALRCVFGDEFAVSDVVPDSLIFGALWCFISWCKVRRKEKGQ